MRPVGEANFATELQGNVHATPRFHLDSFLRLDKLCLYAMHSSSLNGRRPASVG